MPKLLDIKETAKLLNVKESTIYAWVHRKKIPFVKLGASLRFVEDQILKHIEANTYKP